MAVTSNLTIDRILNQETRKVIQQVIDIIEARQHLRRNPSRFDVADKEVNLELDVLKVHIIKTFTKP